MCGYFYCSYLLSFSTVKFLTVFNKIFLFLFIIRLQNGCSTWTGIISYTLTKPLRDPVKTTSRWCFSYVSIFSVVEHCHMTGENADWYSVTVRSGVENRILETLWDTIVYFIPRSVIAGSLCATEFIRSNYFSVVHL